MMMSIVEQGQISFKTLEQKIFAYVCELGREITRTMLEEYDAELAAGRDRSRYRDKGKRATTIKTVYGEVSYSRRVYQTRLEDGQKAYVYLLDDAMHMDKIGLVSTNLAEKIAMAVTGASYRASAEAVSSTCGQSISHGGAWDLIQELGERISDEEDLAVRQMEMGKASGEKAVPVLFEEMDGVWLHMQGKGHKKAKEQEMKVFTMYEGWDARSPEASRLVGKRMLAGMEGSEKFHKKREALIEKTYAVDEIGQRVLNGDGGSWIREVYDPEAIFQLDRYHIYQEILRKIRDKEAQQAIRELFERKDMDGMLEYIQCYADRVASDDEKDRREKNALELYGYLSNNRGGLMPWKERGIEIPEAPEGIIYKGMGVQEGQNCSVITLRMKHRRMRWSTDGADHMAKVLYRKADKDLIGTIERYTDGLIPEMAITEAIQTLSAAKAPKKDGKGSPYADRMSGHMPLLDAVQTASRKVFRAAFCH